MENNHQFKSSNFDNFYIYLSLICNLNNKYHDVQNRHTNKSMFLDITNQIKDDIHVISDLSFQ